MNEKFVVKAYAALFKTLKNMYDRHKSDSLAVLMGDMNPYLFSDGNSADPTVYEDFRDKVNECCENESETNVKTAFLASMNFLKMYNNEFGLELSGIISEMKYGVYQESFNEQS